jgi:hypothetical protein
MMAQLARLLALGAALRAADAPGRDALSLAESLTRQARAQLEAAGPAAPGPRLDGVVAEAARQEHEGGQLREDLLRFHVWLAYRAGSPVPCAALAKLPVGELPADQACRSRYRRLRFDQALLTGSPRFAEDCRAGLRSLLKTVTAEETPSACAVIRENAGKPTATCDRLTDRGYLTRDYYQSCVDEFGRFAAYAAAEPCGYLKNESAERRDYCEDFARFRRAREMKDAKACADSALCRLLLGDEAALRRPAAVLLLEAAAAIAAREAAAPARPGETPRLRRLSETIRALRRASTPPG